MYSRHLCRRAFEIIVEGDGRNLYSFLSGTRAALTSEGGRASSIYTILVKQDLQSRGERYATDVSKRTLY